MSEIAAHQDIEAFATERGWLPAGEPCVEAEAIRLRVGVGSDSVADLYAWQRPELARRASWCHGGEAGAQLFVVPAQREAGQGWCLIDAVDGIPLVDYLRDNGNGALADLPAGQSRALVQGMGTALRKLHHMAAPSCFGEVVGAEEQVRGEDRWLTFTGYVAAQLESFAEGLRHSGFDDAVRRTLTATIAEMRHELGSFHPRNPPSLIHGRPGLEHFWVDPAGREIVGLTGFEQARYLPREADVAYLLWIAGLGQHDAFIRAFYQGYGAARTMDVQRRERFYRRLVALEALFGRRGPVARSDEELIALASMTGLS